MREIFRLSAGVVAPERKSVLELQGIPRRVDPPARIIGILDKASEIFSSLAEPRGLMETVTGEEFAGIYFGEGRNEPETPLQFIYPQASTLVLFTVTVGAQVCERIRELFAVNEPALGYMLDSVASAAADKAVDLAAERLMLKLREENHTDPVPEILPYSPGYCGWHISGQRRLFDRLRPEEIGMTLNDSFLMIPLKSVSGALIAGSAAIHVFDDDFSFCSTCTTHGCRERITQMLRKHTAN